MLDGGSAEIIASAADGKAYHGSKASDDHNR
jgi:hypothetical protein